MFSFSGGDVFDLVVGRQEGLVFVGNMPLVAGRCQLVGGPLCSCPMMVLKVAHRSFAAPLVSSPHSRPGFPALDPLVCAARS